MHDELQRPDRHEHGPLAGFTVGVTAARRADELGALLQRRGAAVLHAPALRIVPLADDSELLAATKELIDQAPDVVVATTAIGFRGWVEAADGWGLGEALLDRLRGVELLARGPKVKGAVRAAGLTEEWSPSSESMAEVLDRLLEEGVDGPPDRDPAARRAAARLRRGAAGRGRGGRRRARLPVDAAGGHRARRPAARRDGRAAAWTPLTFTSAPAAASLLGRARGTRAAAGAARRPRPRRARRPASGPVTALPLQAHGIHTVQPERFRLGPLVQLLCQELPARRPDVADRRAPGGDPWATRCWWTASCGPYRRPGCPCCGRCPGGRAGWCPAPNCCARCPARAATSTPWRRRWPGCVRRWARPKLIQTVVKRGYRLALDPAADTKYADA